jgi:DNA-directed RNA polymerase subunit N (RpoN/RPB10)
MQVDFFGYTYEQCMVNYKILQQSFNKLGIERVCCTPCLLLTVAQLLSADMQA